MEKTLAGFLFFLSSILLEEDSLRLHGLLAWLSKRWTKHPK